MKKIVKFTKAHQSYSAGDIAGFDPATADDLIAKKKVAVEYEAPEDDTETLTIKMDGAESEAKIAAMVKQAEADLEAKAKARSDELDAREAALTEPAKTDAAKETTSAKPPKQGSK